MIVMAFLFLAVLLAGVPVFIALAGSSFIYTHFIAGLPDFVILHRMAGGIDSFPLLAVPFRAPAAPRAVLLARRGLFCGVGLLGSLYLVYAVFMIDKVGLYFFL